MKMKTIALSMIFALSSATHAEQWIHLDKTASSDIYVNVDQVRQVEVDKHRYKQAWIKTIALKDGAGGVAKKGDYTQSLWRFDCNNATSSILNYVDYRQNGEVLASGTFDNPQQQVIKPSSAEESALFAVCDGKYPQKVTKNSSTKSTTSSNKASTPEASTTQAKSKVTNKPTSKPSTASTKTTNTSSSTSADEEIYRLVQEAATPPADMVKTTATSKAGSAKQTASTKASNAKTAVTKKVSETTKKVVNQANTKK